MDRISKFLKKLSAKERAIIKDIINAVLAGNLDDLDVAKLKDRDNVFRVRKGSIRVIYQYKNKSYKLVSVERRSENTY